MNNIKIMNVCDYKAIFNYKGFMEFASCNVIYVIKVYQYFVIYQAFYSWVITNISQSYTDR